MKKGTKKNKKIKQETKTTITASVPSMYKLWMKLNDKIFETETNDLGAAILSFAPKVLKTKILFRIEKDGKLAEKQVFVQKGKMIFRNNLFLQIFLRHLIFKEQHG